jgi:hypothetical protein
METAEHLFSIICGQARPFVVDGVPLPLGQRCLGLYVGAELTALWVLATRLWRRGLPGPTVVPVNAAMLFAAMLGGLHVIDPGPLWRFGFGLWTGHVAVLWLAGAAGHLWASAGPDSRRELPWRAAETAQALAFPAGLAALAALFPLLPLGWHVWTAAAALGVFALAATFIAALVAAAHYGISRRRPARDGSTRTA